MKTFTPKIKIGLVFMLALLLGSCASLIGPDIKPGIALFEAGKYSESLTHYETIIESGSANAEVYRLAYESAFKAGKRITAGKYYDQALMAGYSADSLSSLATDLWYSRALRTMGRGDWESGKKASKQLTRLAEDSNEDKFCRIILAGKRKYDKGAHKELWDAISDYSKAANYDASSGLPYYLMGQARYKNNRTDYDAALEDYYQSLKVEPGGDFAELALAEIKRIEALKKKMNAFWGK